MRRREFIKVISGAPAWPLSWPASNSSTRTGAAPACASANASDPKSPNSLNEATAREICLKRRSR